MKKLLFHFAAVAVVATTLLTTSCTKDEGNIYRLKIHQYTSADKTSLGDGGVTLWSNGDEVYVNGTTTVQISGNGQDYVTSIEESLPIDGRLYCFYAGNATMADFDATTKTFTYTMPSSITYDGTKLNAPMVGANDGNDVDFENICTMLKLEFLKIPTSITITSENTAISGAGFTASYNGSSWTVSAPAATDGNKTITISNNNYMPYVYVPLPAGNHKLTITATNVDTKEMSSSVEMVKNTIYPIHFAHPFSVSADKKVYFSPGNLQYHSSWRFALNQWDFIGSGNIATTGPYPTINSNDWIDLFYWASSGANLLGSQSSSSISPTNSYPNEASWPIKNTGNTPQNISGTQLDWGYRNPISNGGNKSGMWFTLTKEEWTYLVGRDGKCGMANLHIGNTYYKGLVILPDDFNVPESLSFNPSMASTSANDYSNNLYEESDWQKMEKNGAVFLPGAGYRLWTKQSNRDIPSYNFNTANANGYYWTSIFYNTTSSYALHFGNFSSGIGSVRTSNTSISYHGCSVRLVRNAN